MPVSWIVQPGDDASQFSTTPATAPLDLPLIDKALDNRRVGRTWFTMPRVAFIGTPMTETAAAHEITLSDFANLIASMSRLLIGLGNIPLFKTAEIGLAEWVALSDLSEREGISNTQLAKRLGVTGQRVNQITTGLAKSGLISITTSAQDSRKNEIRVTSAGRTQLDSVNRQLKPLLATALEGKERALVSANRQIRLVMKIIPLANPPVNRSITF